MDLQNQNDIKLGGLETLKKGQKLMIESRLASKNTDLKTKFIKAGTVVAERAFNNKKGK